MTSRASHRHRRPDAVPAAAVAPDDARRRRCPARRSRWAPRPASTSAWRARTSRSPPASPTASPCACSTRPARKPRSRCPDNDADIWHAFVPGVGPGRPTGTGSAGPGTRPGACAATRPSCCSTLTPGPSAERSRSGPRCSARTRPTPDEPSTLDSVGARAAEPGRGPGVRLAGRQPALAPLRGHGHVRDPRQGLHHAPSRTSRRSCAGPTPGWPTRPPSRTCVTSASPPSSCCPCTRTCPRRSWSAGG